MKLTPYAYYVVEECPDNRRSVYQYVGRNIKGDDTWYRAGDEETVTTDGWVAKVVRKIKL